METFNIGDTIEVIASNNYTRKFHVFVERLIIWSIEKGYIKTVIYATKDGTASRNQPTCMFELPNDEKLFKLCVKKPDVLSILNKKIEEN
jgi:hypothetical protein